MGLSVDPWQLRKFQFLSHEQPDFGALQIANEMMDFQIDSHVMLRFALWASDSATNFSRSSLINSPIYHRDDGKAKISADQGDQYQAPLWPT